jgi:hypothetical protein
MLGWMPGPPWPDPAFAVGNDQQYRPAVTIADQQILVRDDDGGRGLLLCHASRSLAGPGGGIGGPGDGIERLLIVVHGALRDSDRYLANAQAAAGDMAGSTLIVAPQFLAGVDLAARASVPAGALHWEVEGWKGGEAALGPGPVSSFAAMDSLLRRLAGPRGPASGTRPRVVIFGSSAGGQYVNRYAATGRAPNELAECGVTVRFVIANPSTYLYFGPERPVAVPGGAGANRWRYGFDEAPAYVGITARQGLERYLSRDVTIVLGSEDRDEAALLLEVSAAAMAQGANRLERGIGYDQHVRRLARAAGLADRHRLIQLAGVGHASAEVLAAPQIREILFG